MADQSFEQAPSGIKIYLSNPWNLIKTGFLVLTWIMLGFHLELVGPTMPVLIQNINVDYSGMGSVLASRAAGYLVANLLGAILQNIVKKHSEGLLVCAFILPAIVVFLTPFVTSWIIMCILFFIQGIAQSFTDLGGTNIILTMWGVNAAAPLNTAHLGYGIGAVCVNLLIRPFLNPKGSLIDNLDTDEINSTLSSSINNIRKNSHIVAPYTIVSILCVLTAAGHAFFYIQKLKNQRQQAEIGEIEYTAVNGNSRNVTHTVNKEVFSPYSPRTCGNGYFQYGLILSTIFICYTFFIGANDQTFAKFFFAYLKFEKFHISNSAASWGIILYWLSYSVGRFIGAILSMLLSVNMCLTIVWFGGLCLTIAWFIFVWFIGLTGTSLFILGAATGLVFAPLFPLTFGLINQRLNVVPVLLALLLSGSALGAIALQKIAGVVMDHNPNHFPTLLIVCILMGIILYIASNVVYHIHEQKNLKNARPLVTSEAVLSGEVFNNDEEL
ncbi:unnamed protein product [Adineta steineri]|uniref:Uncharacterized protein n=1 Tax=Adineta steineri TaxID=433720 RepID=A0A818K2U2_9BILA|nr:unnamed protein product [Adineta steineri]